jgi:hypothetical protein
MALYLVQHTHSAEKCPTKNPEMVKQLSAHVTDANAQKFGVKIRADWVNDDEHTVVLVLESDSKDKVEKFAQPFGMVGSVTVKEGATCADVARQCLGG